MSINILKKIKNELYGELICCDVISKLVDRYIKSLTKEQKKLKYICADGKITKIKTKNKFDIALNMLPAILLELQGYCIINKPLWTYQYLKCSITFHHLTN
jgi:hypothetical protein